MEKRRVVITGMGAVTPLGHTVQETWDAVRAGACGIAPITLYDHSGQKVSLAAEVKNFDPAQALEKKEARRMDRFTQFAVTAAVEAMAQSGLDLEREDTARMGVSVSSGIGGISTIQNSCEARAAALTRSPPSSSPWPSPTWPPGTSPSVSACMGCAPPLWPPAPAAATRWATPSATSGTAMAM